jgi:putative transposase
MTAEENRGANPRKERLHRLDRIFPSSPIYFVTACAFNRRSVLAIPEVHQSFLRFAAMAESHGAYPGRYVIMPDHIHLFVALEPENELSLWMKALKNSLSKTLRELDVPPRHWQKGFFDHVLRSGDSYSEKWEYVRDNPVRAGLVNTWEEWPFSGEVHRLEFGG